MIELNQIEHEAQKTLKRILPRLEKKLGKEIAKEKNWESLRNVCKKTP
jgi:vacuolar-type H+-ATPase subunit E/Vma4